MLLPGFRRRLAQLFRRDRFADELREEIDLHLHLREQRLHDHDAALRQFGNRGAAEDRSREAWGFTGVERLFQDFRLAFRTLRKTPKFTAFAVITLALGLGMNTAVFSVVDSVMLRGLPYPEPERIVSLWEELTPQARHNSATSGIFIGGSDHYSLSVADLLYCQEQAKSFESLAGFSLWPKILTGAGNPDWVVGEGVTWNFFPMLRVSPAFGRAFVPQDERDGSPPVVILTHGFWQRRLGADTAVLSRSILLDSRAHQIVGVLPAGFQSPYQLTTHDPVELYVPTTFSALQIRDRRDHYMRVAGRLRPQSTLRGAHAELNAISAQLSRQFPDSNEGVTIAAGPLHKEITREVGDSLLALLGASGLIVLITCANVANLFLVRALARRHETSVRFALGASRFRIARQFLAESLLVAAAGCAAGVLLGQVMLRVLLTMAPGNIPRVDSSTVNWSVFAAAAAIATLTGLIFGIAPALHASQARAADAIKSASRNTAARGHTRWRGVLTAAELALSLVLLVGAGLLLKSFVVLMGMDLGFQPERVLAMNINLLPARYDKDNGQLRFFQQLEQRVEALPGVVSAAFANRMPMRGGWSGDVAVDTAPEQRQEVDFQAVSPAYFETLGIRLLRGRRFTAGDRNGQAPTAVVSQEFARRFLPDTEPIGHRIKSRNDWTVIVGVVADVRRDGKAAAVTPQVYYPAAQTEAYPVRLADFAIRTQGDPRQLIHAIQNQVWTLDKDQPVRRVRTLEETITSSVAGRRFQTTLLLIFAGVAVSLAVIGVFGVLSFSVTQRTGELGIRIALGAHPLNIVLLVLRQAGAMIAVGLAAGIGGAWLLSRYVASMLFQVKPHDWTTYAIAVAALAAVAVAAAWIPARRGARVDPIVALRWE